MIELTGHARNLTPRRIRFGLTLLASLACLALYLSAQPAQAEEPDDAYLAIYSQIQEAEASEASGHPAQALTNYQRAVVVLKAFQRKYPTWNAKVVNQRLNRLSEKITALTQKPLAPVPARTNAPAAAPATHAAKESSGSAVGKVKVLQPGDEPRKVLRLHPKAGDKQSVEVTLKMGMESKMGAMESPAMNIPPVTVAMDITVKSISPEGDITYEVTMNDVKVAEEPGGATPMAEAIKASLAGVKGLSGTGTVSDRGVSKKVDVKMAGNVDEQSRQMVEQMTGNFLALPEEAVGPGAKWEVRKVSKARGYPVNETETYELVAVEGDRVTLKGSVAQSASRQKIQNPAGGRNAPAMELSKVTGSGTVDLTCDLGQLMPADASAKQHTETTLLVGPQKQAVTQKMDLDVHIQAK